MLLRPVWYGALPQQPTADTIEVPVISPGRAHESARVLPRQRSAVVVPLKPGHPTRFERVRPLRGEVAPRDAHFPCDVSTGAQDE